MALSRAEAEFNGRLIGPYQREGVKWMLEREMDHEIKGGFLCDEMGLGKTIEVIATMLGNRHAHTLIVTPKSVMTQWRDEIRRFSDGQFNVLVWDGPNRTTNLEVIRRYDVVVTSYSLTSPRTNESSPLHKVAWDRVVLDEAHEIRNPNTKSYVAIRSLNTRIMWIVTGTPIFNSIRDFVALCALINIRQNRVQAFTREICERYVLRRTKEDVCEHNTRLALPPCDFENVELDMEEDEKQLYRQVYESGKETIGNIMRSNNPGTHAMIFLECLLRARQVMVWPQLYLDGIALKDDMDPDVFTGKSKKLDTLIELIQAHPYEKSLVFCQFMGEMDEIQRRLNCVSIETYRIDGSVSKDTRQARIESFKETEMGCVFLIQIKAGGVGLNLQEATRVYITSPSWNPGTELQAIARAHRTGQDRKVYVKKLIYSGEEGLPSIEQSIMQLQGHKALICAEVLNDLRLQSQIPTCTKSRITIQDIRKLFA
jgi:SNF2 family DNA or RNA helicase